MDIQMPGVNASQAVGANQYVESILQYFPDNPAKGSIEQSWIYMTDNYSRFQIACWGSVISHALSYFLICLPTFLFQFMPFMQKYKIQKDRKEDFYKQWKCLKLILLTHFCLELPLILLTCMVIELSGIPFSWESMPRWYDLVWRLLMCAVIEDTWHYFVHRLMHDTRLYKHVHKVHHYFQAPFGMTAEYAHPVETLGLGFGFFLALILMANHMAFPWIWAAVRLMETVDVHSGYDFPYLNLFHLVPGYIGTRFHDFHHYNFTGNYAPTFMWWDKLLGTDTQWHEFNSKTGDKKED